MSAAVSQPYRETDTPVQSQTGSLPALAKGPLLLPATKTVLQVEALHLQGLWAAASGTQECCSHGNGYPRNKARKKSNLSRLAMQSENCDNKPWPPYLVRIQDRGLVYQSFHTSHATIELGTEVKYRLAFRQDIRIDSLNKWRKPLLS